jgi:hypothetical protein
MTSPASAEVVARFPIERTRASENPAPPDEYAQAGKNTVLTPRAAADVARYVMRMDGVIDRAANPEAISALIRSSTGCSAFEADLAACRVGLFIVRGEQ